ncbi:hypothetical protein TNCV_1258681 [Trichonephila clavipes]|nr:hypothetical protein TNCV_1258681 [Trichonephila clavipes]
MGKLSRQHQNESPSYCTRNGRSTVGQKLPDDWEKQLDDFLTFCTQIVENNFTEDLIFNMDEVPLSFDIPPTRPSMFKEQDYSPPKLPRIICRQNCRGLYAAADYAMFFFTRKKGLCG